MGTDDLRGLGRLDRQVPAPPSIRDRAETLLMQSGNTTDGISCPYEVRGWRQNCNDRSKSVSYKSFNI
jgi:hypothetical protein